MYNGKGCNVLYTNWLRKIFRSNCILSNKYVRSQRLSSSDFHIISYIEIGPTPKHWKSVTQCIRWWQLASHKVCVFNILLRHCCCYHNLLVHSESSSIWCVPQHYRQVLVGFAHCSCISTHRANTCNNMLHKKISYNRGTAWCTKVTAEIFLTLTTYRKNLHYFFQRKQCTTHLIMSKPHILSCPSTTTIHSLVACQSQTESHQPTNQNN